eukprot:3902269-Rhodomonas_salina.4
MEVLCNCLLALAGCSLCRLLHRLLPKLFHPRLAKTVLSDDHADEIGEGADAAAFPSWELKVLQVEFQGLCLATGAALGSGCATYVNTGIALILCLVLLVAGLSWKMHKHMVSGAFVRKFVPDPAFHKYRRVVASKSQDSSKGWIQYIKQKHQEFEGLCARGEWVLLDASKSDTDSDLSMDQNLKKSKTTSKSQKEKSKKRPALGIEDIQFHRGYGPMFEIYTGDRWWYGIWLLLKHLIQGVVLGASVG